MLLRAVLETAAGVGDVQGVFGSTVSVVGWVKATARMFIRIAFPCVGVLDAVVIRDKATGRKSETVVEGAAGLVGNDGVMGVLGLDDEREVGGGNDVWEQEEDMARGDEW